jgi:hypothetical protein
MSDSKVVDLLGYKYAKKANSSHSYDALMYNLFIKQPQKKTTVIEWTNVSNRLPRGNSNQWFVVLLEAVGGLRTIGSSQFINGEWLQIREGLVLVTHWAEMPKELP